MKKIEDLGAILEEHLILDNRYTEHSTVGLAQQWDQLNQLGMRIKHNLEQQIQARNQSGVSEDALKEFSMMFRHFDKDKSGRLNHNEFKSCLRALGITTFMIMARKNIYGNLFLFGFKPLQLSIISICYQDTTYQWLMMASQNQNLKPY